MAEAKRGALAPVIVGVMGTAILVGLCLWQVQRLGWKEDVIATLGARLFAEPVPLPADAGPADEFLRVVVTGRFEGDRGECYGDDLHEDQRVRVRFVWSETSAASARWEQAFSLDDGATWLTNWIMEFGRPSGTPAPRGASRARAPRGR